MLGPVGLEAYAPQALRTDRIEHAENATGAGEAQGSGQSGPSPHVQVVVSQILRNAESLIASVMGVEANEVSISVNVGRYEF
jgi:hypothetical protein